MPTHSTRTSFLLLLTAICQGNLHCHQEAYASVKASQRAALSHDTPAILMYGFYHEGTMAKRAGQPAYAALLFGHPYAFGVRALP